jgi:hypothetical protein
VCSADVASGHILLGEFVDDKVCVGGEHDASLYVLGCVCVFSMDVTWASLWMTRVCVWKDGSNDCPYVLG